MSSSGLSVTLNNALTGLNIAQESLREISNNVSNVNTPNYSREVVKQSANIVGGEVAGVTLDGITRQVDLYLTKALQQQSSALSAASTTNNYAQNMQNLLGQPGATSSIDTTITSLFTALQSLSADPSQGSLQLTAVNAGIGTAQQLSQLANNLEGLRYQADQQIGTEVSNDNATLSQLNQLNGAINSAFYAGKSTAPLLDKRDALLNTLGQSLDINYYFSASGTVNISTNAGYQLLGNGTLYQLSYASQGSQSSFSQDPSMQAVQIYQVDTEGNHVGDPTTLVTGGFSGQVSTTMKNGAVTSLLQVRDQAVPAVLDQLDQLAATLRDQLNAAQNSGTNYPGATSYTGTRSVTALEASQWTGSARIAVLDGSGQPVASPYAGEPNGYAPLTLDLGTMDAGFGSGRPTNQSIINAINSYFTPQNKARLGDLNNIQLVSDSTKVTSGSPSLNFDFNLENLKGASAGFFVTGTTVMDDSGHTLSSTNTLPSLTMVDYKTHGTSTVTVDVASTGTLKVGDSVYLPTTPGGPFDGITGAQLGGFFTVSNVTGTSFDITAPVAASGSNTFVDPAGELALTQYAAATPGDNTRTAADGTITADFSSFPNSSFYTISANVAVLNADGSISQGTIQYQVNNNTQNMLNQAFAAQSVGGSAALVVPSSTAPLMTAMLVDASGNELPKVNGQYVGTEGGFLKLVAGSGNLIAVDSMDSAQQGLVDGSSVDPGTGRGFMNYFEMNNFFSNNGDTATGDVLKNSALNLAVSHSLIANPSMLSTGVLAQSNQPADPTQPPNYTYRLTQGDNSVIQRLATLGDQNFPFSAAGGLGATFTTFNGYAGNVLGALAASATTAQNNFQNQQTIVNGSTTQQASVSGVNLDQELGNMILFQNAYAASARVISTTKELFTQLLGAFQ